MLLEKQSTYIDQKNFSFLKNKTHLTSEIEKTSNEAIIQYIQIYPLLSFFKLYSSCLKVISTKDEYFAEKLFFLTTRIINNISHKNGEYYYSEFNNIIFEIIKDYIFLYQQD